MTTILRDQCISQIVDGQSPITRNIPTRVMVDGLNFDPGSDQFPDRIAIIDQIMGPAGRIDDSRVLGVDSNIMVERG